MTVKVVGDDPGLLGQALMGYSQLKVAKVQGRTAERIASRQSADQQAATAASQQLGMAGIQSQERLGAQNLQLGQQTLRSQERLGLRGLAAQENLNVGQLTLQRQELNLRRQQMASDKEDRQRDREMTLTLAGKQEALQRELATATQAHEMKMMGSWEDRKASQREMTEYTRSWMEKASKVAYLQQLRMLWMSGRLEMAKTGQVIGAIQGLGQANKQRTTRAETDKELTKGIMGNVDKLVKDKDGNLMTFRSDAPEEAVSEVVYTPKSVFDPTATSAASKVTKKIVVKNESEVKAQAAARDRHDSAMKAVKEGMPPSVRSWLSGDGDLNKINGFDAASAMAIIASVKDSLSAQYGADSQKIQPLLSDLQAISSTLFKNKGPELAAIRGGLDATTVAAKALTSDGDYNAYFRDEILRVQKELEVFPSVRLTPPGGAATTQPMR